MAVNLSPVGGVAAQFFTNSGAVLTGGKLYTYAAGTTTPAATYTSSSGSTAQPNPIVLDAAGRVPSGGEIWLTDGLSYKFILRDANDVLIATYDNITGINSNFVAFTNQQEIQTATAGQTVFNLTTMSYQPGTNSLSVFVDGVNQYGPGAQYAYLETDSDTVTFINGLHVGAEVKFTTSQLNSSGLQANAFQVSYTPPFTNSVATNVGDKLAQTVSVKDFGAVGDGVTDDTTALQNALNAATNKILLINKPSVKYISGALTVPSNIKIVMEPGAIIETNATLLTGTLKLLNITGSNVHIVGYGATIQMVKAGFSSQFNHGVSITGAAGSQIVIEGLSSNDSGGDGFYVDAANAEVTLYDCKANNNRRQGMSIIQCKSLTDYRGQYTNTTGTAPSAGIDIEPDQTGYSLGPIRLVDTICSGNDGPGIEIFLEDWATPTNYADIQIIGLKTSGNGQASINGRFRPGIDVNRMPSTSPCKGRIVIQDAFMEDEGASGITVYDWDVNGPVVDIVRPTVINPNQNNANNANVNGGIICVNTGTYTANSGNIFIRDPIVRDDDGYLNSNSLNPYRFTGAIKVAMENPTYAYAGSNPWSAEIASTPTINSQVEITANFSTNLTMTDWRYVGRTVTIGDSVAIRICTLPIAQAGIVLRVVSNNVQPIWVRPNAADQIVPIGIAAGKYITATGRGSAVTLRCRTAGFWDIEDVSGTWTSEP